MIKKIAFIGITGNLAPFTYRELIDKGIHVKALVRNKEKLNTIESFPKQIQVMEGNLSDINALRELFSDVDAVYLNLSTTSKNADFQPEIQGITNVIKVAKETNIQRIFHVSAMTAAFPEFTGGATNFINEARKKGYQLLNNSGIPCTFFHCSWIMDTIEFAMRRGNAVNGFKPTHYPFYWLAGKDLGRMIATAVINSDHQQTKDYMMQGTEPLTFKQALTRYAQSKTPQLKVQITPSWLLKLIGVFNQEARFVAEMADFFRNYKEQFKAEKTWDELGKPQYNIDNFWQGKS